MRVLNSKSKILAFVAGASGVILCVGLIFQPQQRKSFEPKDESKASAELKVLDDADEAIGRAKEVLDANVNASNADTELAVDQKLSQYLAKFEQDGKKVDIIRQRLVEKKELIDQLNARFKSLIKPAESDQQAFAEYQASEIEYHQEMAQILSDLDEDVLK